jgi:hypothetical protein
MDVNMKNIFIVYFPTLSIINNCSSVRYYAWRLRSAILLALEMMNEWSPTFFFSPCVNLHNSMPAMNYFDSNRTNMVIFNFSWTVCTRHLVAVPFTPFGNFELILNYLFLNDDDILQVKVDRWLSYVFFQEFFFMSTIQAFFFIGIYFFISYLTIIVDY